MSDRVVYEPVVPRFVVEEAFPEYAWFSGANVSTASYPNWHSAFASGFYDVAVTKADELQSDNPDNRYRVVDRGVGE